MCIKIDLWGVAYLAELVVVINVGYYAVGLRFTARWARVSLILVLRGFSRNPLVVLRLCMARISWGVGGRFRIVLRMYVSI